MERYQQSVRFFAKVTAGRYYTVAQLHRLCDLIARVERLTEEERVAFEAFVFDPRFAKIKTVVDSRNAFVLAMAEAADDEAEYHRACIEAYDAVKDLWFDKESWIAFAHGRDKSFDTVSEEAFFAYAVGDVDRAKDLFLELACANHLTSVRVLVALYAESGESDDACEWLAVYKRDLEELYHESLPVADRNALDAYLAEGRKQSYDAAYVRYLDYFDAFSFGGMQFTAGGKN